MTFMTFIFLYIKRKKVMDKKKITKTYSIQESIYKRFDELCKDKNINRSRFIETKINEFIIENWTSSLEGVYSFMGTEQYVKVTKVEIDDGISYVILSNGNKLNLDDFEKIYTEKMVDPNEFFTGKKERDIFNKNQDSIDEYLKTDRIDDAVNFIDNKENILSNELLGVVEESYEENFEISPMFLNSPLISPNQIGSIMEIFDNIDKNDTISESTIIINNGESKLVSKMTSLDTDLTKHSTLDYKITSFEDLEKGQLMHIDDGTYIDYDYWVRDNIKNELELKKNDSYFEYNPEIVTMVSRNYLVKLFNNYFIKMMFDLYQNSENPEKEIYNYLKDGRHFIKLLQFVTDNDALQIINQPVDHLSEYNKTFIENILQK